MTPGESQFVEEMGQFLGSLGMTLMSGRMWGWLLICEPVEQTAADISEALQASRGAISGTARLLANAGLIQKIQEDPLNGVLSPPFLVWIGECGLGCRRAISCRPQRVRLLADAGSREELCRWVGAVIAAGDFQEIGGRDASYLAAWRP